MKRRLVALVAGAALIAAGVVTASGSITGTYITTVRGKSPSALNGDWVLHFDPSGKYVIGQRVGDHAVLMVTGHAVIAGGRITFRKETGPAACKGSQAIGRYAWSLKGKTLKLTRYSDTCVGRRAVLAGAFTKVQ
jgi:hypothetical protein